MAKVAMIAPSTSISRMAGSAIWRSRGPASARTIRTATPAARRPTTCGDIAQPVQKACRQLVPLPQLAAPTPTTLATPRASTRAAPGRPPAGFQSALRGDHRHQHEHQHRQQRRGGTQLARPGPGPRVELLEQHAAEQRRQRRRAAEMRRQGGAGGDQRDQQHRGVLAGRGSSRAAPSAAPAPAMPPTTNDTPSTTATG